MSGTHAQEGMKIAFVEFLLSWLQKFTRILAIHFILRTWNSISKNKHSKRNKKGTTWKLCKQFTSLHYQTYPTLWLSPQRLSVPSYAYRRSDNLYSCTARPGGAIPDNADIVSIIVSTKSEALMSAGFVFGRTRLVLVGSCCIQRHLREGREAGGGKVDIRISGIYHFVDKKRTDFWRYCFGVGPSCSRGMLSFSQRISSIHRRRASRSGWFLYDPRRLYF